MGSDVGIYDRVVVQELVKEIAQTQNVDTSAKRPFKVVLFNEADSLSKDAQHALRRTLEKYMANIRVILICNSLSKIIPPIRSRCFLVRVPAPSIDETTSVLQKIARKEKLDLPETLAQRIAELTDGNLRKAILLFETAKCQQYPFTPTQNLQLPDYETYIQELAMFILQEQSPARIQAVRTRLYDLLSHCIPADTILLTLLYALVENVDESLKCKLIEIGGTYEHRLRLGSKAIFHLEAFVIKAMTLHKEFVMGMMQF